MKSEMRGKSLNSQETENRIEDAAQMFQLPLFTLAAVLSMGIGESTVDTVGTNAMMFAPERKLEEFVPGRLSTLSDISTVQLQSLKFMKFTIIQKAHPSLKNTSPVP